jgi:hypothetical protein
MLVTFSPNNTDTGTPENTLSKYKKKILATGQWSMAIGHIPVRA